jgi:hypothetical protein
LCNGGTFSRHPHTEEDEYLEEPEELASLRERKIIDVTDEPISFTPGSVTWGQTTGGTPQTPHQQTKYRSNPSAPASTPRRSDPATKGAPSVYFADQVLAFTASEQPSAHYFGFFDLNKSGKSTHSTQHLNLDKRGGISQYGSNSSSGSSGANISTQRGMSRHTHTHFTSYRAQCSTPAILTGTQAA